MQFLDDVTTESDDKESSKTPGTGIMGDNRAPEVAPPGLRYLDTNAVRSLPSIP